MYVGTVLQVHAFFSLGISCCGRLGNAGSRRVPAGHGYGINTLYNIYTLLWQPGNKKKKMGFSGTVVTFIVYWCGTSDSARQRRMSHRCPITLTICLVNMAVVSCCILNGRVLRLYHLGRYISTVQYGTDVGGKLRVSLPRIPIRP